jgi:hypothetical protein
MKGIGRLIVGVVLCFASGALAGGRSSVPQLYLPEDLVPLLKQAGVDPDKRLLTGLNPFYLSGDFDGDGQRDYAVEARLQKWTGFLVLFGNGKHVRLERDSQLEFPPADHWHVHPRNVPVRESPFEDEGKKVPTLKGDAILFIKHESSSSLVYWDGTRFVSYWQAD